MKNKETILSFGTQKRSGLSTPFVELKYGKEIAFRWNANKGYEDDDLAERIAFRVVEFYSDKTGIPNSGICQRRF